MESKLRVGILACGDLGLSTLKSSISLYDAKFIATDSKSKGIINFTSFLNIPLFVGNPNNTDFFNDFHIDALISLNYIFLIDKRLISLPKIVAINFHGSLLPKYRGRTPHVWAIINGENKCGITAHVIDSGCDTGDIIYQHQIDISDSDTGNDVLNKFKTIYPIILKKVVNMIKNDSLNYLPQNHKDSTYFPKRTPDDGRINWDWDSKRIRNWVRAQAFPYPGAFTYINDKKVIFDKIEISDQRFNTVLKNGTIIKVIDAVPYVKVRDGIIKLISFRTNIKFKVNDVFE